LGTLLIGTFLGIISHTVLSNSSILSTERFLVASSTIPSKTPASRVLHQRLSETLRERHGRGVTQHTPIAIDGNAALATFIANEGLPGNGTSAAPYIIEGLSIDARTAPGIGIQNTNAYLIIRNCTIEGGMPSHFTNGISLRYVTNVHVNNNTVTNNYRGINLQYSNHNTMTGNLALNNEFGIDLQSSCNYTTLAANNVSYNTRSGISLESSYNNILTRNTASYNAESGIDLDDSDNTTLDRNTASYNNWAGIRLSGSNHNMFSGNMMYGAGLRVSSSYDNRIDPSNRVNAKAVRYYENTPGVHLSGESNVGQVILLNCDDSLIEGLFISQISTGITVIGSDNCSILDNTVTDCYYHGIWLQNSNNNTITGNYASYYNGAGISLRDSCYNTLAANNVSYNTGSGIHLYDSLNNTLARNTVTNNGDSGIRLTGSNNTLIVNYVSHNTGIGIEIHSYSGFFIDPGNNHTTLAGNTVINNSNYGIFLCSRSNYAHVFYNNLIGNNHGSTQASDSGSQNIFAYNYWDEWRIPNINGDGIVDNPYAIDGAVNNQDAFPLVAPIAYDEDFDDDGIPNWYEIEMGLNSIFDDSADDLDHDGLSTLAEYRQGTRGRKPMISTLIGMG
jgi:parallel beta-helix repeat protein